MKQLPLEGRSLVPTFTDPAAKTGHDEQYFEIFGNRAIYKDGWVAGARRYAPWELFTEPAEVFARRLRARTTGSSTMSTRITAKRTTWRRRIRDKLAELKAQFDREAKRNDVYPLVPVPLFGAPTPLTGRDHFVYAEGVDRVPLAVTPDLTDRHHRLTAEIEVPQAAPMA